MKEEDRAGTAGGVLSHGPLAWIDRRAERVRAWDDAHPGRGRSSYWRCFNLAFVLLVIFRFMYGKKIMASGCLK